MRRPNAKLVALLAVAVAWTTVPNYVSESTRDIKTVMSRHLADDVSAEALVALEAAAPGVGVPCTAGFAGPYTCENVDLEGLVPLAQLGGAAGNDSWGWTSADGQDIAMMGTGRNVAFVDVTDPTTPTVIGLLPTPDGDTTEADGAIWRDMKVVNDHAFIVSERGGGVQVVDLNALAANPLGPTGIVEPVTTYKGLPSGVYHLDGFHNIVANDETDTIYLVGVDSHNQGGMIFLDVADPAKPTIAGRFSHGLTIHDAQCTIYRGPDADYNGNYAGPDMDGDADNGSQAELCFTFDEDEINIVDVSDKKNPTVVNTIDYTALNGAGTPGADNAVTGFYAHQGWLTQHHDFLIFNDELDELNTRVGALTGGTTTYWVELADLDAKDDDGRFNGAPVQHHKHDTLATDHNLYVKGDLIFEANYTAGLRVLRYPEEGLRNGELTEVGFFDVDPGVDSAGFAGAWNVYPFFESGTILVSSLDEGLYTLRFNDPAEVS